MRRRKSKKETNFLEKRIRKTIEDNPDITSDVLVERFGVSQSVISKIAKELKYVFPSRRGRVKTERTRGEREKLKEKIKQEIITSGGSLLRKNIKMEFEVSDNFLADVSKELIGHPDLPYWNGWPKSPVLNVKKEIENV